MQASLDIQNSGHFYSCRRMGAVLQLFLQCGEEFLCEFFSVVFDDHTQRLFSREKTDADQSVADFVFQSILKGIFKDWLQDQLWNRQRCKTVRQFFQIDLNAPGKAEPLDVNIIFHVCIFFGKCHMIHTVFL